MKNPANAACAVVAMVLSCAVHAGKPIALMGFGTDVKTMKSDVTDQCRYESEVFVDKWVSPADYGRYSVLYFGEKLRGEAKGRNWREGDARAAAEKFIADGGTVIVAGRDAMTELFGKPDRKSPDALRDKVTFIPQSLGRMKVTYARANKPLSFADSAGNDILTDEGRRVAELQGRFMAAFGKAKDVRMMPELEKWDPVPLGEPGNLKYPSAFPKKPRFAKPAPRKEGLAVFDGAVRATVALGDAGESARGLAEELAWHLERMCGSKFDVVSGEPESGPALVYRKVKCPSGFARGNSAYFRIWREGDKVYLGGDGAGKSRATTYVLEALGCRYIWPGKNGKIIPKRNRIVLPEIAVEDAVPFAIRRMRLYGWDEFRDREGNRDFWRWHGMNDIKIMTTDRPGDSDGYQWGHYFEDFYPKYHKTKPHLFALQPDGTRKQRLGKRTERPTLCLSNQELVDITVKRKIDEFARNPSKKALSLCLPDGAPVSWCLCEGCRKLDPVNAPSGNVVIYFPKRGIQPYVSMTDRVFEFMNRVTERVAEPYPDKLLSTYAYSCYTKPPVRVKPHPNLLILSVAGNYANAANDRIVEENLAAWSSFGNKVMWRPNVHMGFRIHAPDNFARKMFSDISLLAENGIFGFDFDSMYNEWATKCFSYYMGAKAQFNPDRVDFDSLADDYCRAGFGAAAKPVRAFLDAVERFTTSAAEANAADVCRHMGWVERRRHQNRLLEHLDFDALEAFLSEARRAADGDDEVLGRIARLQFGMDLGRFSARKRLGRPSKPTAAEDEAHRRMIADYLARDPSAFRASQLGIK